MFLRRGMDDPCSTIWSQEFTSAMSAPSNDYVIMKIMNLSRSRTSRVFTISFPEDVATQVEEVVRQESRNISELFREAFRTYRLESMQRKLSASLRKFAPCLCESSPERMRKYLPPSRNTPAMGNMSQ